MNSTSFIEIGYMAPQLPTFNNCGTRHFSSSYSDFEYLVYHCILVGSNIHDMHST